MKNKDIQFFFNRPERPVNSGRISTIRSGSYSDSSKISAVSDDVLDAFMKDFHQLAKAGFLASVSSIIDKARALFRKSKEGTWKLHGGEHEECKCKADFDPKKMTAIVKSVAALANNKGGYIFFGVSNAEFKVEGVGEQFTKTDIVQIVEKVKAHLSPTPLKASQRWRDEIAKGIVALPTTVKDAARFEGVHGSRSDNSEAGPPVGSADDGQNYR